MEGINLNSVSHVMLLVESKYSAHLSKRERERERKSKREADERESDDKYFNLDGICLAVPSQLHKPNHLCFTAEEDGFRAGLNGVCKIFSAFVASRML